VNQQNVLDQIRALVAKYQPRVLALDMSRTPDLEYSALQALMEYEQQATESGAVVWVVGLNPSVLEMVRNSSLDERLGRERMLFNAREAIQRYQAMRAAGASSMNSEVTTRRS
jgi:MFS superfamily sulfate permease-like transporter